MSDDPTLSWSQLRAFESCARLLSFSAAAAVLNVSTSAVRFQVGLLEARLNAKLFERSSGRLALTAIGEQFSRRIARPMSELRGACADATRGAVEQSMILTAPPLFARCFLLGTAFLNWCDVHHVQLDVSDGKRDVLGSRPIAAIRLDAEPAPNLRLTPLVKVSLCLAATPNAAALARPEQPGWWAGQTLLCPSAGEEGWALVWSALGIASPAVARRIPYASYAAALTAACVGAGLILAPLPLAAEEFAHGRLAAISEMGFETASGYSLVMRDTLFRGPRGKALARRLQKELAANRR